MILLSTWVLILIYFDLRPRLIYNQPKRVENKINDRNSCCRRHICIQMWSHHGCLWPPTVHVCVSKYSNTHTHTHTSRTTDSVVFVCSNNEPCWCPNWLSHAFFLIKLRSTCLFLTSATPPPSYLLQVSNSVERQHLFSVVCFGNSFPRLQGFLFCLVEKGPPTVNRLFGAVHWNANKFKQPSLDLLFVRKEANGRQMKKVPGRRTMIRPERGLAGNRITNGRPERDRIFGSIVYKIYGEEGKRELQIISNRCVCHRSGVDDKFNVNVKPCVCVWKVFSLSNKSTPVWIGRKINHHSLFFAISKAGHEPGNSIQKKNLIRNFPL